jgi:hypothetical protein
LREAGKLLDIEKVKALLAAPVTSPIALPEPRTRPLRGREIAERARRAYLRVLPGIEWVFEEALKETGVEGVV